MTLTEHLEQAKPHHVPRLVKLLGTPASGDVKEQHQTLIEWAKKRRIDDHKKVIENHSYEQIKPPLNVIQKEQCFGRYFSAQEPYCSEKCAFAAECVTTLRRSISQIIHDGISITESKEGLTKEERKKIMAKDVKNAKKAVAATTAVKKPRNPEPEDLEEEDEPTLEDEDEVEEVEEEEDEAPRGRKVTKAVEEEEEDDEEEDDEEEEAEEAEEEDDDSEDDDDDSEDDDEDEEEAEEAEEDDAEEEDDEEEEEEKPVAKGRKAAPAAAPAAKAPAKAAAPSSFIGALTKKVIPFAPFGADVVVKLNNDENTLKGSDSAFDLVNELLAVAEESRVTQVQFLECIQKVFVVSDDKAEQGEVCKGVAEELKEKGVLKLIRFKA